MYNLPAVPGQIVYKICPCKNSTSCSGCAFRDKNPPHKCKVGVIVYEDGSCTDKQLYVHECKVTEMNFYSVLCLWNIMFFGSKRLAECAVIQFHGRFQGGNSAGVNTGGKERYKDFLKWEKERRDEVGCDNYSPARLYGLYVNESLIGIGSLDNCRAMLTNIVKAEKDRNDSYANEHAKESLDYFDIKTDWESSRTYEILPLKTIEEGGNAYLSDTFKKR